MATAARHTWFMSQRQMRALFRQPVWIALTLVQPIIWIILYGQLFKRITDLGSFGTAEYLTYLTPGIVVMTALFSGGWNGFGVIEDIKAGVMDRFLVTPASRSAIIVGRLVQLAIIAVIQSAILLGIGALMGANYSSVFGVLILIFAAILLGATFGALSIAMSVVVRKEETVIAAVNFVVLPLTFLSTLFLPALLVPGWIEGVSTFNPVNWAVVAGRAAVFPDPDWGLIGTRIGLLAALALACTFLATRAFGAYQRSV
jgi:ABC-2 type transport system permease protein